MIKCNYRVIVTAALLGGAGFSVADDGCQCREVSLGYTSGHIDGHPQGPANAVPVDSYSPLPGRSFNSLGFDGFHQWNFKSHYDYGRNRFYLDYDRTRLEQDYDFPTPTAEDFEGVTSPTGYVVAVTPLQFSSQIDYYRLGYQRLFELEWFGRRLTLAPGVEMNVLDFDYDLERDIRLVPVDSGTTIIEFPNGYIDSFDPPAFTRVPLEVLEPIPTPVTTVRPSYTKWGLRIGGEAEYQLSERLSLTAEVYDGAPIDDWPDVFTGMLGIRYRLFGGESASVYLFGRGGTETIKLDRDETPWNDLRAEYSDLIEGGITVRF